MRFESVSKIAKGGGGEEFIPALPPFLTYSVMIATLTSLRIVSLYKCAGKLYVSPRC
jgi:hypothetical protein